MPVALVVQGNYQYESDLLTALVLISEIITPLDITEKNYFNQHTRQNTTNTSNLPLQMGNRSPLKL